jgi:hypothetical protein
MKDTKRFKEAWIEKFKADMREKGADIGVLETEAMSSRTQRMGMIDGFWLQRCFYDSKFQLYFTLEL